MLQKNGFFRAPDPAPARGLMPPAAPPVLHETVKEAPKAAEKPEQHKEARLVVGPEFSRLLPVAALFGAMFMLVIDTVARTLAIIEVPPGILTAVIGTPVFIALLARARRAM